MGDIGVSAIIKKFLLHKINVLLPFDDNSSYDLVIYIDNKFYKIQVKTTEKVKYNELMEFSLCKTNPYAKENVSYNSSEVDYFCLYCLENDWCGLMPFEPVKKSITIRLTKAQNNQSSKIRYAEDYEIDKQIKNIWGINKIVNKIEHKEIKKKYKKKKKLCPVCNKNYIKMENKTCRECYLKK